MGIKQLSKLLQKQAASTMGNWSSAMEYKDKTVAIDASPCLYQCLTAMGDTPVGVTPGSEGDTSHLLGFLRRTVRLLEVGIKPVFVFDGEAPDMKKTGVLTKREELRARSREQLEEAQAVGDEDAIKKHAARLVKVTQRHNDEVMELLRLMGVPAVQAPGEAECYCAVLAASGRADAAATEDMDALPFGAPRLLRNIHRAASQPQIPLVQDISLSSVLSALAFTQAEFVDLCILAGCDYLGTISKVGIVTAHQLVKKHRSIDVILRKLDAKKYIVPEGWDYQAARNCFLSPDIGDVGSIQLDARPPDAQALRRLLVQRHSLREELVDESIRRLLLVRGSLDRPPEVGSFTVSPSGNAHSLVPESNERRQTVRRPVATPARRLGGRSVGTPERLPRGQKTLAAVFAMKRPTTPSEAASPQKRRRHVAMEVIQSHLGNDIALSGATQLEDLERLAAELGVASDTGVAIGNESMVWEDNVCCLDC
eukprot:CAMPEP_0117472928 /NCGR_PEP_ID=MMETSP0784-20121206/8503_1 /TAXON_ID=39447 /ORGANISM="" /LENGTH=481 /DNA_ID=CAMNT_0005267101 /DNA_START=77 /DNA_END=1522 /DNA_ORIENTATION=+